MCLVMIRELYTERGLYETEEGSCFCCLGEVRGYKLAFTIIFLKAVEHVEMIWNTTEEAFSLITYHQSSSLSDALVSIVATEA